jgi:hypothetical protein
MAGFCSVAGIFYVKKHNEGVKTTKKLRVKGTV